MRRLIEWLFGFAFMFGIVLVDLLRKIEIELVDMLFGRLVKAADYKAPTRCVSI